MKINRINKTNNEAEISLNNYIGLNLDDPKSTIKNGEFSELTNVELYTNYIKSRNGMSYIHGSEKTTTKGIFNITAWDVGNKEYFIYQTATKFFYIENIIGGTEKTVKIKGTATDFTFSFTEFKLVLNGNKLYCFSTGSVKNVIIEYDSSNDYFVSRKMGLDLPVISSYTSTFINTELSGEYVYGVELVYRNGTDNFDTLASTPNRKNANGTITKIFVNAGRNEITVTPPTDNLYTHVRLYRSKRLDMDTTSIQFNDVSGTESELYPVQLVTKATFISNGYKFVDYASDDDLPAINAQAWYTVNDINSIELKPIGGCKAETGTYHKDKIWIAGTDITLNKNRIYYSNYAGTPYSEQFSPLNFKDVDVDDGQRVVEIISFEKDLIVIKESKTLILLDGDTDYNFNIIDYNTGILTRQCAKYFNGFGIIALTNGDNDIKILGSDLKWNNSISNIPTYNKIKSAILYFFESYKNSWVSFLSRISIVNINNRIFFTVGISRLSDDIVDEPYLSIFCVNTNNNTGWVEHRYTVNDRAEIFKYDNGNSIGLSIINDYNIKNCLMCKLYDTSKNTDLLGEQELPIISKISPSVFKIDDGRKLIEYDHLSLIAEPSDNIMIKTYLNGKNWTNYETLLPDVNNYNLENNLKYGEYNLYLNDRLIANYFSFSLKTKAPFIIHNFKLYANIIDGNLTNFDPFQQKKIYKNLPLWGNTVFHYSQHGNPNTNDVTNLNWEIKDLSGNERHLTSLNKGADGLFDLAGQFGRFFGTSLTLKGKNICLYNSWNCNDLIKSINEGDAVTFEFILGKTTNDETIVSQGGYNTYYGNGYFKFIIKADWSFEFHLYSNDDTYGGGHLNKKYKTPINTGALNRRDIIQLTIYNNGDGAQFYSGATVCVPITTTITNLI